MDPLGNIRHHSLIPTVADRYGIKKRLMTAYCVSGKLIYLLLLVGGELRFLLGFGIHCSICY
jgi:hypothetical protein